MTLSRREAALTLAEEILSDIELSRLPAPQIVRKASRLARLSDDVDAVDWLSQEVSGFDLVNDKLTASGIRAAKRSRREAKTSSEEGGPTYWSSNLNRLQADIDAGKIHLQAAIDRDLSISSANPKQVVVSPPGNAKERVAISNTIRRSEELLGRIVGSVYIYVSKKEIELRFGAAIEDAFTTVRNEVDGRIAQLAPSAATKLSAAFENAASGNPEHWANAASACRRLLKAIADELRHPGEPVDGRPMTDDKYINRLIDWIVSQHAVGDTLKDVVTSDLEDFGKRIDAFDDAGHKGAHAEVTKYEASRFITGAYLLIGDILRLWAEVKSASANAEIKASITASAEVVQPDSDNMGLTTGPDLPPDSPTLAADQISS
ncbi:hypothetical protein [Amycolatopsis sp. WQ 127309]|uniref:AbiTii domain-containing protein n=1 Tax=Amycolatopsis sp. WQ 127309 TaxID=2932773 RepID=UPI001FF0EE90|nr:hypothetical protein [Amycolatopsis sp. WQ 127309]UOZ04636.1 hypothetical protein MUY22_38265 [Amycolatopsis sp. WQ 127309]